jgi:cephalosporin hydroxylase
MVGRSFGGSLLLLAFAFVEVGAVLNVVNFRDSANSEKRDLVRRIVPVVIFLDSSPSEHF